MIKQIASIFLFLVALFPAMASAYTYSSCLPGSSITIGNPDEKTFTPGSSVPVDGHFWSGSHDAKVFIIPPGGGWFPCGASVGTDPDAAISCSFPAPSIPGTYPMQIWAAGVNGVGWQCEVTLNLHVACASNYGSACNFNSCGTAGGSIQCDGSCSGSAPVDPWYVGAACNRNSCGGSGTYDCSANCTQSAPPQPGNLGAACNLNSCGTAGGAIQCDGSCSGATPADPYEYGTACNRNSCGGSGTYDCTHNCTTAAPADTAVECSGDDLVRNCSRAVVQTCTAGCNLGACSCNTPWGTTILNGTSVTAYSISTGTPSNTCASNSQTRTCTNGILSGSYTNESCTADKAPSINGSFGSCVINSPFIFRLNGIDPEGGQVRYVVDWGDGNSSYVPSPSTFLNGGIAQIITHIYAVTAAGIRIVHPVVFDTSGNQTSLNINVRCNCPLTYQCAAPPNQNVIQSRNSDCSWSNVGTTCSGTTYCAFGVPTCQIYSPLILSPLNARPSLVRKDTTATITWSMDHVTACRLTDSAGTEVATGLTSTYETSAIQSQMIYTLSCDAYAGYLPALSIQTVTINVAPEMGVR